jgi:hypothetical protein
MQGKRRADYTLFEKVQHLRKYVGQNDLHDFTIESEEVQLGVKMIQAYR